ncbi:origin recognition complex subunit 3 N-terminus-domain-containing protein [Aspergillus pseudonomiae]|uniref:Origin recognition complex subunit 3 N-terminus-domain-containing protein n=1 Tax=Aspergillus pseudonomiae TaxID=1506151 RepID=A0A5N7DTG3_9EURO|nr:origin recognition complex subunit 3 N-terminus-domain-containing protein [Aspergillus pseudonomiae]KAB8257530.1 origin recognition complex subunit 3 N-terminus-domain-containing protein [Aspergillus pseudonomiae]KAE8408798.1 origin recognition complex subunit 3 N-terminus-domain-containing protein [Aspergillus pseudonomiae]
MDLDTETQGVAKDGSNTQGVYIYRSATSAKAHGERPSKRRKVQPEDKEQKSEPHPFVPLLDGEENESSVELRYNAYRLLWSTQETKIQEILDDVDSEVLENVLSFVRSTSHQTYDGCIPTALITVGSNVSSLGRLLAKLNNQLTASEEGGVVILESGDAPNLKATLKNIIRAAVTNTEGNDGYQNFLTDREGPRLLGYDLDLLGDYVKRKGIKKLVVAFRDSEAFDPNILTDLLSLLSSWLDRIPFTLLFGISTSVELFEGRLPRSSVALLRGRYFEIHGASNCVDRMYERLQADQNGRFWLGRNITGVLFEKSNDYFQTPEAFTRTVKYAYMTHFFANPLAILLSNGVSVNMQDEKLCEAIRNLPSFRRFCEHLLDDASTEQVRNLLENDEFLFQQSLKYMEIGQQRMRDIFQVVKTIYLCLKSMDIRKNFTMPDLSIRALSGELQDSTCMDDLLRGLKTLDSSKLKEFLTFLPQNLTDCLEFQEIKKDFEALVQTYQGTEPLRSEYDSHNSIVATTVVQQRVKLSKSKAKLPQQNIEYTKVIDRVHALSERYFVETLVRPQDLFLHEAFLLDMKNPLKEIFSPRPRFAIERALANPFDYLMSMSDRVEAKISARQPATAILYQLYLESGALVNVYDLWQAFYAVFESEQGNACDERMTMTLFYRAVSELKALGMLKSSRKKVDHAAKSAWIGL